MQVIEWRLVVQSPNKTNDGQQNYKIFYRLYADKGITMTMGIKTKKLTNHCQKKKKNCRGKCYESSYFRNIDDNCDNVRFRHWGTSRFVSHLDLPASHHWYSSLWCHKSPAALTLTLTWHKAGQLVDKTSHWRGLAREWTVWREDHTLDRSGQTSLLTEDEDSPDRYLVGNVLSQWLSIF